MSEKDIEVNNFNNDVIDLTDGEKHTIILKPSCIGLTYRQAFIIDDYNQIFPVKYLSNLGNNSFNILNSIYLAYGKYRREYYTFKKVGKSKIFNIVDIVKSEGYNIIEKNGLQPSSPGYEMNKGWIGKEYYIFECIDCDDLNSNTTKIVASKKKENNGKTYYTYGVNPFYFKKAYQEAGIKEGAPFTIQLINSKVIIKPVNTLITITPQDSVDLIKKIYLTKPEDITRRLYNKIKQIDKDLKTNLAKFLPSEVVEEIKNVKQQEQENPIIEENYESEVNPNVGYDKSNNLTPPTNLNNQEFDIFDGFNF